MATRIKISLIDVPPRLRPVDGDWAEALAEMFRQGGQRTPIEVSAQPGGRFKLVAGAHRLAAAGLAGWEDIKAELFEGSDQEARLAEIDENLGRHELNKLDRAVFLAERQSIWLELHPETAHGGDRKSKKRKDDDQVANFATRFSKDASEKLGMSERLVQNAVRLANSLSPEVRKLARETYLFDHAADLDLLSRLAPKEQLAAVKQLRDGSAPSLRKALGVKPAIDDQEKAFRSLIGTWARANAKTRKRFLTHVGQG